MKEADQARGQLLLEEGKRIALELESKLSQPRLSDLAKSIAPFLVDGDNLENTYNAIEGLKSYEGMGPLREILKGYLDWYVNCDHFLTEIRCRTERRAKRIISLRKEVDTFLNGKISRDKLLFSVREQVHLLESIMQSPPEASRVSRKRKETKPEAKYLPFIDQVLRKVVQAVVLGIVVVCMVAFFSESLYELLSSFGWTTTAFIIGSSFWFVQFLLINETRPSAKIAKYLLLAGYVMTFLWLVNTFVPVLRINLGYIFDVMMVVSLAMSELAIRWKSLDFYVNAANLIQSGLIVVLCIVLASVVSELIGQPIWVGLSILAAIWSFWNNSRKNK